MSSRLHFWVLNPLFSSRAALTACPKSFKLTSSSLSLHDLLPVPCPASTGWTDVPPGQEPSFRAPSLGESRRWDPVLAGGYSWMLGANLILCRLLTAVPTPFLLLTMSRLSSRWHLPLTSTQAHHVPEDRAYDRFSSQTTNFMFYLCRKCAEGKCKQEQLYPLTCSFFGLNCYVSLGVKMVTGFLLPLEKSQCFFHRSAQQKQPKHEDHLYLLRQEL